MPLDPSLLADTLLWDIQSWAPAIEYWERNVDWTQVNDCLELGGREGGLSLYMALKGKSVVCSDVEDTSQRAEKHLRKYHLDRQVRFQTLDATNIPYENHFDVVAFKSVLGGVGGGDRPDRQQAALDQIHKALKPGGKLLFAENLDGSLMHRVVRKRYRHWGAWWRYVTLKEMSPFLSKFSKVQMQATGVLAIFGRTERQRRVLSALDRAVLNHVTPRAWRYIVYGIAEK